MAEKKKTGEANRTAAKKAAPRLRSMQAATAGTANGVSSIR